MPRFSCLVLALFVAVALAFPALAAEPPLPAPLEQMKKDGAQMRYLGRDLGFDAWIAVKDAQEQYFYVMPDQSAFFLGVLFNKNGRAITFDQLKRAQGKAEDVMNLADAPSQKISDAPDSVTALAALSQPAAGPVSMPAPDSPAEKLFGAVEASRWIQAGSASAPAVYAFIDPLCPHCKDFLKDIKPAVDGGQAQVRAVPVGVVSAESLKLAAGLLAAPDAVARLWKLAGGDSSALSGDGSAPTGPIEQNIAILQDWKFDSTPLILYRAKDGTVKLVQGRPKKINDLLQDLP